MSTLTQGEEMTKQATKKKPTRASKLNQLAAELHQFQESARAAFQLLDGHVGALSSQLGAVIEAVGEKAVGAAAVVVQERQNRQQVEAEAKQVADGVAAGHLKPAEIVTDRSIIIMDERQADGSPSGRGRYLVHFDTILNDLKTVFHGVQVGFSHRLESGVVLEVAEIYEPAEQ